MSSTNFTQSLWDFSLWFYAQPQVEETCLYLQNQHDANICLVIALRWMDLRSQYLTETDFTNLESHIQPWTQQFIEPLRSMRRQLKLTVGNFIQDATQEQLRELIKKAELLAEKKVLDEIEIWSLQIHPTTQIIANSNLKDYLRNLNEESKWIRLLQNNT
jgi:uncharacterized protein (TIGR02444 family)